MKNKQKLWLLSGMLLSALLMLMSIATYIHHIRQIRAEIEQTFLSRNELLHKFVTLQQDQVTVMRNLVADGYRGGALPPANGFQFSAIAHDAWSATTGQPALAGIFSGSGQLPASAALQQEMHAATAMEPQLRSALQHNKETAWLYYLSARNFIYIAPPVSSGRFRFSPALYQRDYWRQASPQQNPSRRMTVSGPYNDLAQKGEILTFALPVYQQQRFLGIVGLDLQTDTLKQLTNVGQAVGESMLISESRHLITRQSGGGDGDIVRPPLSSKLIDWRADDTNDLWLSAEVVKGEMWLVHRVKQSELYLAAARESSSVWVMIAMFALLCTLALQLVRALQEVTLLMHVDPLTRALNRRGFYEHVAPLLAQARRDGKTLSLLMMDIDFFKKINDNHGHDIGDAVLRDLGMHLKQGIRSADIVCRWGGEEFIVLMPLKQGDSPLTVAEAIRAQAQQTMIEPAARTITLSGGLVLLAAEETVDDAIKRADQLLYEAKQNGRNQIRHQL